MIGLITFAVPSIRQKTVSIFHGAQQSLIDLARKKTNSASQPKSIVRTSGSAYPTIQMSDKWPTGRVISAILKSRANADQTHLSATDREILQYINDQTKILVKTVAQNRDEIVDFSGGHSTRDIIVMVNDKDGHALGPQILTAILRSKQVSIEGMMTKKANAAISSCDDFVQYDFNTNTYPNLKKMVNLACEKLRVKYGFWIENIPTNRSDIIITDKQLAIYSKIKIKVEDTPSQRPYYQSSTNLVVLDPTRLDQVTIIHELAHAFHGPFVQQPLWEEGMATAVSEIVMKEIDPSFDEHNAIQNHRYYWQKNLAIQSFAETNDTEYSNEAYNLGAPVMRSLHFANNNFFLAFNLALYQREIERIPRSGDFTGTELSRHELIQIADSASSGVRVEERSVRDWFRFQYPFIERIYGRSNSIILPNSYILENNNVAFTLKVPCSEYEDCKANIRVSKYDGTTIASADYDIIERTADDGGIINISGADLFAENYAAYQSYTGMLRFVIDPSFGSASTQYMPKLQNFADYNFIGIVEGGNGDAHVEKIGGGYSASLPINNGLFFNTYRNEAEKALSLGDFRITVKRGENKLTCGENSQQIRCQSAQENKEYSRVIQRNIKGQPIFGFIDTNDTNLCLGVAKSQKEYELKFVVEEQGDCKYGKSGHNIFILTVDGYPVLRGDGYGIVLNTESPQDFYTSLGLDIGQQYLFRTYYAQSSYFQDANYFDHKM